MTLSALQSRLARTGTGLGVRETAFLADVSPETITRIEKGEPVKAVTLEKVAEVYGFLGVVFLDDVDKPGVAIDLQRLSAVKSGIFDNDFCELRGGLPRRRLHKVGTFLKALDAGKKWTSANWTPSE